MIRSLKSCCFVFVIAALSSGALAFSGAATVVVGGRSQATWSSSARSMAESPVDGMVRSRREMIGIISKAAIGTAALVGSTTFPSPASALDMDSFERSLIEKDTTQCDSKLDAKCIPKLTPDEALCKYGVSGADARTAACRRVRDAGGQLPTSKVGERSTQGWLNGDIALSR
mmetsp:Transcript_403/g.915  ORF Transcript_403/g.915 Transcript_403/m.915 type:complete len:172 (-) Transcript_403:233-748(-)